MDYRKIFLLAAVLSLAAFGPAAAQDPCNECAQAFLIHEEQVPAGVDDFRPGTVRSCKLIDSTAKWNNYCRKNGLTDCRTLTRNFFETQIVVVVAVDTFSPVHCNMVGEVPSLEMECLARPSSWEVAPRISVTDAFNCQCTANVQYPVTEHMAQGITDTGVDLCTPCIESRDQGCALY
jgi:hypothetical protein